MTWLTMKLGTMRKPQDFTVLFDPRDNTLMMQSDKSIGQFDATIGVGVFNQKGCYFIHLNAILGAKPMTLTPDQLSRVKEFAIQPGQEIGPGVRYMT